MPRITKAQQVRLAKGIRAKAFKLLECGALTVNQYSTIEKIETMIIRKLKRC